MLHVRGLERPGLGPIDLELAAGECVAILGASGTGKTLLLRALADLDPSEGQVALDGTSREALRAPLWRRRVTYLATDAGWWSDRVADHFTNRSAAATFLSPLGLPDDALDWSIQRLSSGEKQRLALARVLAQGPQVLLLDEPTATLDEKTTGKVEALLKGRLEGGAAILLVTHDRRQAERLGDRVLRLEDGRLLEEEP